MKLFKKIIEVLRENGISFLLRLMYTKIRSKKFSEYDIIKKSFAGKAGLEVGGPSGIFKNRGFIPIYKLVKELDGCNFSSSTIWEGEIINGQKYCYYKNKSGTQYISDATDLTQIKDSKYDFVISSNCLEHVANPIKALKEWLRVLKADGLILLVLPNKNYCFDHNRTVVEFSHLVEDYNNKIEEDSLMHLDEILRLHDLSMDKAAGTFGQFKARSLKNFENRTLHHHVFDLDVLKKLFSYFNLEIILTGQEKEYFILGKKKSEILSNEYI